MTRAGPLVAGSAAVRVPASSANLGPGFDALALAVGVHDEYSVRVVPGSGASVTVHGPHAGDVATDGDNLIVRSLIDALDSFGGSIDGALRLDCRNRIPHGRGLGSSAAAIVGGVCLAARLAGIRDRDAMLQVAARIEGHPDNVAAALLGGFVTAWITPDGFGAVSLAPHPDVRPVLLVPGERSPTDEARVALPSRVPHADAAYNVSRAALLVHALTVDPGLLMVATEDRLHQEQRRAVYPDAMALVGRLRDAGVPAAISGAGPTVIAFPSTTTAGEPQLPDVDLGDVRVIRADIAKGAGPIRAA